MISKKKAFIVHGFEGAPNGGWRPWLMDELSNAGVYACALSMPNPANPVRAEWVAEVARHIERNAGDQLFLVGHSLGVATILRFLESAPSPLILDGVVLVSGPCAKTGNGKIDAFVEAPFAFEKIRSHARAFTVIHGDDDDVVPFRDAGTLSEKLGAELIPVPGGGHLTGSEGWRTLPPCLKALRKMMV
jgi:hypothetical protein